MSTTKAWIRMPLELLQRDGLSKSAAVVLGVIIDRCTDRPDGCATISRADIAHTAGYSIATVRRALEELFRLDLIEHARTGRASAYKLTGCVELLPPKQRGSIKQQQRAEKEAAQLRNEQKAAAYLSLVNQFKGGSAS